MSIKDHVGADKKVYFVCYRDNTLFYKTEAGLEFSVPCQDTGTGTFLPEDKSIFFMRWIRKHLEMVEAAKREQEEHTDQANEMLERYGNPEDW